MRRLITAEQAEFTCGVCGGDSDRCRCCEDCGAFDTNVANRGHCDCEPVEVEPVVLAH